MIDFADKKCELNEYLMEVCGNLGEVDEFVFSLFVQIDKIYKERNPPVPKDAVQ